MPKLAPETPILNLKYQVRGPWTKTDWWGDPKQNLAEILLRHSEEEIQPISVVAVQQSQRPTANHAKRKLRVVNKTKPLHENFGNRKSLSSHLVVS